MTQAFVFSGQGLQYVGMGAELMASYPRARDTLAEGDDALGEDLSTLIAQGPAADLTLTRNAQPALLLVSVAWARVLGDLGIAPSLAAGHSLGEYSALVTAGSLALADAVRLVRRRGDLMQQAVPSGDGGMLALIGGSPDGAEALCRRVGAAGHRLEVAADNCPGNQVVSGLGEALALAQTLAPTLGFSDAISLAVSAPFHSAHLVPAADAFADALDAVEIRIPEIPVLSNVTAEAQLQPAEIRANLRRQVFMPLRWRESLIRVVNSSDRCIQVGPGRALLGHLKRLQRRFPCFAVDDARDWAALTGETA